MSHKVAAVITAGGTGTRMGRGDKLLCRIGGKTVLERTLEVFEKTAIIDAVILVKAANTEYDIERFRKIIKVVNGGKTRFESVYNGVMAADGFEFVAIHDAARPLVTENVIESVTKKAFETGAAITGYSVIDTVKTVNRDGVITSTPDREMLFAAATPQVFRRGLFTEAYKSFDGNATDDASVVESIHKVYAVTGDRENIKITTPFDLLTAEEIVRIREENDESRDRT